MNFPFLGNVNPSLPLEEKREQIPQKPFIKKALGPFNSVWVPPLPLLYTHLIKHPQRALKRKRETANSIPPRRAEQSWVGQVKKDPSAFP